MLLCCKIRTFTLTLAIWNIERHDAFAQGTQWLLRESTNTEILIECFFCFFFPAIWPLGEWKHDSFMFLSWPALGLIWWAHSECIGLTDIFTLLQKAGPTFEYKSQSRKPVRKDNCVQKTIKSWSEKKAGFGSQADLPLNPTTGSYYLTSYDNLMNFGFLIVKRG